MGIPKSAPIAKFFSVLGTGLGIPSEPHSSKVRLIVLLPNRVTSGIHAQGKVVIYLNTFEIIMHFFWVSENPICSRQSIMPKQFSVDIARAASSNTVLTQILPQI